VGRFRWLSSVGNDGVTCAGKFQIRVRAIFGQKNISLQIRTAIGVDCGLVGLVGWMNSFLNLHGFGGGNTGLEVFAVLAVK
jgi:hypothetical protein